MNQNNSSEQKTISVSFTDIQKEGVRRIFCLYDADNTVKNNVLTNFMREWDNRLNLKQIHESMIILSLPKWLFLHPKTSIKLSSDLLVS